MDLQKILCSVKSLNDYIAATEKIASKYTTMRIDLNMSTVLNLKKVRSLEIEYFNKCEDVGAAFVLFERMLTHPPSKTWKLLAVELTATLLYWLDAVRKHLITHSPRWWSFLETVLKFISALKSKDQSLPGIIVEKTTECLLDLSCNDRLDELQRHIILRTLNECSADSSRELRLKMKDKLSGYFTKLSRILPTSGHFPTQVTILEALLRWLVGRLDPQVRRAAALAWFPQPLYKAAAVEFFLQQTWTDFSQNAREFLNLQNEGCPERVMSTVCKQLTFGTMDLLNGPQARTTWLDVNGATRTITIILDPRVFNTAAAHHEDFETVVIGEENVISVQLHRSSSNIMVSVHTATPLVLAGRAARAIALAISSRRLPALDRALRAAFGDKYRVLLNLDDVSTSPEGKRPEPTNVKRLVQSSDEIRRSNIPLRRRCHSGFALRSRNPLQFNTPSSASTTSLAQLHERLAALPPICYNKEPVKICAQPELSMVREVSEGDERSFSQSSITKSKRFGVCQTTCIIDNEFSASSKQIGALPVTEREDEPVSSMLIATLGSTDPKYINDTWEKIKAKNAGFNVVDLIAEEALRYEREKDSGITVNTKTQDSEVIENTPAEKQVKTKKLARSRKAKCKVVSKSTTDESNTEPVNEVTEPCFVTDRKKRLESKGKSNMISENSKSFDAAAVDAFFSKHYTEKADGCVFISPKLARKLNETSSEGSECNQNDMDEAFIRTDLTFEADIIDCLNNIVDEVCCHLEKSADLLSKQQRQIDVSETAQNVDKDQNKEIKMNEPKTSDEVISNDCTKVVSLKYPQTKKRAPTKKAKQKNVTKDKKVVTASQDEDNVVIDDTDTHSPVNKPNTPLIRKKRKLYSPKDDANNEDEVPRSKVQLRSSTETPIATCYKELEIARQTRSRIPRKLRTSSTETSPKTKKLNDMFDKLKERVENEETITLVKRKSNKDMTVYNFSSDSENEDFKKKKIDLRKRTSKTSLESTATKRGRNVKRERAYSEENINSSSGDTKRTTKKRKVVKQTKPRSRKVNVERCVDLIDERMREGPPPEVLETSFVKEDPIVKIVIDPEPTLAQLPQVEMIPEVEMIPVDKNDAVTAITVPENKSQTKKKAEMLHVKKDRNFSQNVRKNTQMLAIKKEQGTNKIRVMEQNTKRTDSGSDSSLPGLVVETEQPRKDIMSSSVEANLMQKFKKLYREGPDLDDSDATQNLLLRTGKTKHIHVGNKDMNSPMRYAIDATTCEENFVGVQMNEHQVNNFEIIDLNKNTVNTKENIRPVVLTESPSEKTIETGGKSPITGHNDSDELPPNMASLEEKFKERDLEIQDMDQSMADFFVELRSALQISESSTSNINEENHSELPFTRMSSEEQAVTPEPNLREQVTSQKSTSTNNVTTPVTSLRCLKVVLPVDEIEKYVNKEKEKSFFSKSSASVVLHRISSDEINKWLPMPRANSNDDGEENSKKKKKRATTKKQKRNIKKTPRRKAKAQTIKPSISPVKLSFDVTGHKVSRNSSANESTDVENLAATRSKARQLKTSESQQTIRDVEQDIEIVEKITTQESSSGIIIPDPVIQPGVAKSGGSEEINEYASKSSRSISEWIEKNVAASQYSSTKDKTNDAIKDTILKVMETLQTTLTEIHHSTGKKLASMLLENQKDMRSSVEELCGIDERINSEVIAEMTRIMAEKSVEKNQRFQEVIAKLMKEQKERACDVLREDKQQKIVMVTLLEEDLQAIVDFIDRQKLNTL